MNSYIYLSLVRGFREDPGNDSCEQYMKGKVLMSEISITWDCRWEEFVGPPSLPKDNLGADFVVPRSEIFLHFRHV